MCILSLQIEILKRNCVFNFLSERILRFYHVVKFFAKIKYEDFSGFIIFIIFEIVWVELFSDSWSRTFN